MTPREDSAAGEVHGGAAMTTPITLADLRESADIHDSHFIAKCIKYVSQQLKREVISERWEVRSGTEIIITYRLRKHFPSRERELSIWISRGYVDVTVVHVTVYRAVKR